MAHPNLIPDEFIPDLRSRCLQEINLYARRAEQTRQLASQLDKNGIECIYFKGFVVRDYYPFPELRSYRDVDFVIHKEDRKK